MFKFLKKKLSESINIITSAEKKTRTRKTRIPKKKAQEEKSIVKKIIKKATTKRISEEEINTFLENLELTFLENNVAYEVVQKISYDLREELIGREIKRARSKEKIKELIKEVVSSVLLEASEKELINEIKKFKPFIILFVGINGSGKTTTLAKLAYYLKKKGFSCVASASDTFRAASIEQLEIHSKKVGFKVIKHNYGSDAAAVAFDAVKHAQAKGIDVVLIDTAGRQHSNKNLMNELEKIKRVIKPHVTIFVGDSLAGNDVVIQAQEFNNLIGFDYTILTKADVDEKGGAILSASYVTKKPILFLGTGQEYRDLSSFKKEMIIKKLLE